MKHERGTTRKGEMERTKDRQTLNDSPLGGWLLGFPLALEVWRRTELIKSKGFLNFLLFTPRAKVKISFIAFALRGKEQLSSF